MLHNSTPNYALHVGSGKQHVRTDYGSDREAAFHEAQFQAALQTQTVFVEVSS